MAGRIFASMAATVDVNASYCAKRASGQLEGSMGMLKVSQRSAVNEDQRGNLARMRDVLKRYMCPIGP